MRTYIQLGRTGDILTLLPFLWADAQAGRKQSLMVASEFSGVLDGVSYVNPVIFEGSYAALDHAVAACKQRGLDWVSAQVNGPVEHVKEFTYKPAGQAQAITASYQKESWKAAGRLKEWDRDYPLVFDRRDPEREAKLLDRVLGPQKKRKKKPLLLLSMEGISSPFKTRGLLDELIGLKYDRKYTIVDLSKIKAERIYDLLAFYERAMMIVATDSAPLHLARACPELPVVALVNDKPLLWHGSAWQPQHVVYCRYGDFETRFREVISAIENTRTVHPVGGAAQVVHVYDDYTGDRRLHPDPDDWFPLPIKVGMCGRDTKMINDELRLPFLKDCLRMGMQVARAGDYIALSRPDTYFKEGINDVLLHVPAAYSYRFDTNGEHNPIVDLFAATKEWWAEHLDHIPDLVLGRDYYWSHALWAIFSKNGAINLINYNYRDKHEPAPAPAA